jgi:gliding motility-associated-like protein
VVFFLLLQNNAAVAQSCPSNIDFETGTFTGWTCYTGGVAVVNGRNVISLDPSGGPVPNQHTIMSAFPGNGFDPFGGFPINCPNGSGHSIKLGNTEGENRAEGASYDFIIPANRNEYNLIYHYAVVFQDPKHREYEQPRMEIEVKNITDGVTIGCSSFAFFPFGTPLPGFLESPVVFGNAPVWYKDWSAVSVNLDNLAGKHIQVFFKTADCTFRRHFGYAYIDVNSECDSRLEGASFCPDDTVVNVTAPYGYQSYTWYNQNFSQVLGSQQTLTIPPPPTSINVAVVVVPYNGYGCIDTLYTDITNNLVITADAGRDTVSCNKSPIQIGSPPQLGVNYQWSPIAGLSNPNIANPLALPDTTTIYIVTVRSKGGGCLNTDTVKVKASIINNDLTLLGKASYCIGSGDSAVLVVQKADSIQWYKNNVPIIGANQQKYKVLETGNYYATLFGAFGCSLSTVVQPIDISTIPVIDFTINTPNQCLVGNQYVFTNNSTNDIGEMKYKWVLGDGTTSTLKNLTHKFSKAGIYKIKLFVNSSSACIDSSIKEVTIYQNAVANFFMKTTCINIPTEFINTTADTLGSPINYLWRFPNGQTSTLRNPPSQTFTRAGTYDVSLSVYSNQCPTPIHSIKKPFIIDVPKTAIRYPLEYAVINLPLSLQARQIGETYLWDPLTNLSNPNIYNPIFKGDKEQLLTVAITTKSGCTTTDTQLVKLVKDIQIYVPNVFTPNGDNVNDVLKPLSFGITQIKSFKIFNRWGQLFFETQQLKQGWDGRFKGVLQETQTVVWYVEAIGADGKTYLKKGATVLLK